MGRQVRGISFSNEPLHMNAVETINVVNTLGNVYHKSENEFANKTFVTDNGQSAPLV